MKYSIVIPTYNRAEILKKCLDCLEKQTYKDFEVIIVNDGGDDEPRKFIKEFKKLGIKYIYQKHSQQGVARNKGIDISRGDYIIFIGDDILPSPEWLENIDKTTLERENEGVLGLTLWHPDINPNEFMKYLAPNGPQFNYGIIKNKDDCGWGFFWTSNICVPRKFLEKERFDENFVGWGCEDLELGYRLQKNGLKICFNPKAIAYHYHYYGDSKGFFENQKNSAKAVIYCIKKHPELKKDLIENNKLKYWHKILLGIYSLFPFLKRASRFNVIYWKLKRRVAFNQGLK